MKENMEMFYSQLLHEVKRDAIKKSLGSVNDERIFRMISYMKLFNSAAYKQGPLALEIIAEVIKETESHEFGFGGVICSTVDFVLGHMWMDDIAELLTTRYWAENLQKENALMYYMLILSVLKILYSNYSDLNNHVLEIYLTACLSEGKAKQYRELYKEKFDKEAKKLYNLRFKPHPLYP